MKIKKKELAIGIVAIILIATIGTIYGLSKSGGTTDELKKIEKTAKKEDKKKVKTAGVKSGKAEDKKTDTKSDVKAEDEKKEEIGEKVGKSDNNGTITSSSARSSTSSTNPPSHSSSSSSGTAPAPKPRWVVDQAAWDETVEVPVYKTVTEYWIRLTNGTILTYESWNECENAMDKYGSEVAANGSGSKQVLSGYNKTIIHHEEVGHWE